MSLFQQMLIQQQLQQQQQQELQQQQQRQQQDFLKMITQLQQQHWRAPGPWPQLVPEWESWSVSAQHTPWTPELVTHEDPAPTTHNPRPGILMGWMEGGRYSPPFHNSGKVPPIARSVSGLSVVSASLSRFGSPLERAMTKLTSAIAALNDNFQDKGERAIGLQKRTLLKCHTNLDEVFLAAVDSEALSEEVCQQVEFLLKESDEL